jgi:flagellar motor switch protein FliN/FliY
MGPIDSVKVQISAVLGTVKLPINQLLRMGRGAVIELDATEEDAIEIRANNVPVAFGEITIQNQKIAVTITERLRSSSRRGGTIRTLVSD